MYKGNPLLSLKFDQKAKIYCSQIKLIYSIRFTKLPKCQLNFVNLHLIYWQILEYRLSVKDRTKEMSVMGFDFGKISIIGHFFQLICHPCQLLYFYLNLLPVLEPPML